MPNRRPTAGASLDLEATAAAMMAEVPPARVAICISFIIYLFIIYIRALSLREQG
jgi:hypothetical protein